MKEENCQWVTKKVYSVFSVRKRKYINYKDLSPKYINDNNYSSLLIYYFC